MSLLIHSRTEDSDGVAVDVTPESAGWTYVGFKVVRLRDGRSYRGGEAGREACIVPLSGTVTITTPGAAWKIGGRTSVFDGPTSSAYIPAGVEFELGVSDDAEVAICTAPGTGAGTPRLIPATSVGRETRGAGTNTRYVSNILPESEPAESLLVVEVVTPGGNWSSYPPHKHDRDSFPDETLLEETYYHRLTPPAGLRRAARLHRRPLVGRDNGRERRRCGDGPARLSSSGRGAWVRPLLSERHGRPPPRLALRQRSGP